MSSKNAYQILGLSPGATEKEIKSSYRKLAKKYHPDVNDSPQASKKFQEITAAYDELLEGPGPRPYRRDPSYDHVNWQKEKEKARRAYQATNWAKARAREAAERKKQEEADRKFRESEWYDLFLLAKYLFKGLLLIFSIIAILGPIILGLFVDIVAFLSTIYFMIIGVFLLMYIWERRDKWFKLGSFNTKPEAVIGFFKKPEPGTSNSKCYYCRDEAANGAPYIIRLVKVLEIKKRNFGAMNHQVQTKQASKSLGIPRSIKAEMVHRFVSLTRITLLIVCSIFLPIDSVFWRVVFGLLIGGFISGIILLITLTKSKTSFIITPALLIKLSVWIIVIAGLSDFVPWFSLVPNEFSILVIAALIMILDMIFDLAFGFFPFYDKLFKPIAKQGKKLTYLYNDGFQNYIEYPGYSIIYPLFRWLF